MYSNVFKAESAAAKAWATRRAKAGAAPAAEPSKPKGKPKTIDTATTPTKRSLLLDANGIAKAKTFLGLKGYAMGAGVYDPKVRGVKYKVKRPDGSEAMVTPKEIDAFWQGKVSKL